MILADTSAWVEFFGSSGSPTALAVEQALVSDDMEIGDLIAVEVLQGIKSAKQVSQISQLFDRLEIRPLCGAAIAPLAAANYRMLRRKGITVRGTIDVIIATWCIENGARLLHNDRDFDRIAENLPLQLVG